MGVPALGLKRQFIDAELNKIRIEANESLHPLIHAAAKLCSHADDFEKLTINDEGRIINPGNILNHRRDDTVIKSKYLRQFIETYAPINATISALMASTDLETQTNEYLRQRFSEASRHHCSLMETVLPLIGVIKKSYEKFLHTATEVAIKGGSNLDELWQASTANLKILKAFIIKTPKGIVNKFSLAATMQVLENTTKAQANNQPATTESKQALHKKFIIEQLPMLGAALFKQLESSIKKWSETSYASYYKLTDHFRREALKP